MKFHWNSTVEKIVGKKNINKICEQHKKPTKKDSMHIKWVEYIKREKQDFCQQIHDLLWNIYNIYL